MRLPRTISFDASDRHIFEVAAGPGEWAVSGAALFAGIASEQLTGKLRQAFANGFLGIDSLGHSTFVIVATASEMIAATQATILAEWLVTRLGAPSRAEALAVAKAEFAFAADLCRESEIGTLFAVRRSLDATGGIKEEFRTVRRQGAVEHTGRLWTSEDDHA